MNKKIIMFGITCSFNVLFRFLEAIMLLQGKNKLYVFCITFYILVLPFLYALVSTRLIAVKSKAIVLNYISFIVASLVNTIIISPSAPLSEFIRIIMQTPLLLSSYIVLHIVSKAKTSKERLLCAIPFFCAFVLSGLILYNAIFAIGRISA